ncbi:hypothetical protein ACUOIJ_24770, partial [Escherichia coli]
NEEIDIDRIQFNISENVSNNVDITVASITEMAIEQDQVMQTEVAKQRTDDQPFFTELTGMAKQYKIVEAFQESVTEIILPQFFLTTNSADLFNT